MNNRRRENQPFTPNQNNNDIYSIHTTRHHDWELFMWLASLKNIEDLVNLFIVIWDAAAIRRDSAISREFSGEINKLMGYLELFGDGREIYQAYHKTLSEYKDSRLNEDNASRHNIIRESWRDLKSYNIRNYAVRNQLNNFKPSQKHDLRNMIFSRMESFHSFANKIKEPNEGIVNPENEIINPEAEAMLEEQLHDNDIDEFKQEFADTEWRDDDENNSMQLMKDIEKLNRDLNKITGVKRNVKEIKEEAVKKLFTSLGCTDVENGRMKLVLEAALQQRLINLILESANNYFKDISEEGNSNVTEDKFEAVIISKTKELIELSTRFEETRQETDRHPRILPIRIRQQSYAALGNRGFSIDHPFIKKLAEDLINEMNKYRIIESEEKNKKFEKEIVDIIIKVIRIFYFRLETQDPVPLIKFYESGEGVNLDFMEGGWDGHHEDYEVEICSFPVVFSDSDKRVYNKAQIIVKETKETFD